jgi:hypothetical protein
VRQPQTRPSQPQVERRQSQPRQIERPNNTPTRSQGNSEKGRTKGRRF